MSSTDLSLSSHPSCFSNAKVLQAEGTASMCMSEWMLALCGTHRDQKRALNSYRQLQAVVSHLTWVLNSGPLEEYQAVLTTEPSLESHNTPIL